MSIDTIIQSFFVSMQTPVSLQIFNLLSLSLYAIVAVALIYLIYKKNKIGLTKLAIGGLLVWVVLEILKVFTGRVRPDLSDSESFPSRHAGLSFFVAGFLPIERKYKILLYIWAILICIGRLALNQHWFTDVLAGSLIGLVFAYLITKIHLPDFRNRKIRQFFYRKSSA